MYKVIYFKEIYLIRKEEPKEPLVGYAQAEFCGFDFVIAAELGINVSSYCTLLEEQFDAYEGFYGIYFKDISNAIDALEWINSILLMQRMSKRWSIL